MKVMRKIIEIDEERCTGCGLCVPSCEEGAIQIVNGKAKLVAERYCDGLGACLGECPEGALRIVEREAEDFDEAAVAAHLDSQAAPPCPGTAFTAGGGCPGARIQQRAPRAEGSAASGPVPSALTHWPVQIRLVPPTAPYLQNADLLVAADCVPVAYAGFHQELLQGRVVMVGCPKFDQAQEATDKFAAIFSTAKIKSVTVAVMQVPCCQSLPGFVRRGMQMAGTQVPGEIVVVSLEGKILARKPL